MFMCWLDGGTMSPFGRVTTGQQAVKQAAGGNSLQKFGNSITAQCDWMSYLQMVALHF
jgi:hypothetical protein